MWPGFPRMNVKGLVFRNSLREIEAIEGAEVVEKLLEALLDLEAAVASMPTANPKPDLRTKFEQIDTLTGQLPKGTHPQLIHYLQRKSYQKARLFLQGRDVE